MTKQLFHCPKCNSPKTVWNMKARRQRICRNCGSLYTLDGGASIAGAMEELKDLRIESKENAKQLAELEKSFNLLTKLSNADKSPPKWMSPKKAKNDHATASVMLSDLHLDEIVYADQVNFVNAYSRKIAKRRMKLFFENTIKLARDHMAGIELDGLVLNLGGDMVSGNIHEELKISNEDGIMSTVLYWTEQLIAGIEMVAEEFPHIYIPCVTGNHGRNSMKPVKKGRNTDNFDWLIYKMLEMHFKNHGGGHDIVFDIPMGTDCRYNVYKTRYQLTHGDQFRGGGGISGIWTPINLGDHRKRQREQATNTPYDILLMGHFHQLIDGGKFMINGSLKGYDEYAYSCNFGFELPRQLFWLTDPIHGKTITAPIHVYKKGEGWEA